jgi:Carbohydrate-selective porin, OprB family/S-layer homology domain
MNKKSNLVALLSVLAAAVALTDRVSAEPISNLEFPNSLEQVTNVSELRDVSPGDWAYEALRGLVERYGCIAGYPNSTFRGDRPLTRYEFAAGLNSCLNQVERLIQESQTVTSEDIEKLQRLTQEFQAELAKLGTRVDKLAERVAFLEEHQFSTTTKLSGEIIFSLAGASGGEPGVNDPQIVFNDRVRINLTSSFTGKDLLITGLQAYNFAGGSPANTSSLGEQLFPNDGSILAENMTQLSYEPQFAGFNPADSSSNCGNNSVCLYKLLYIFPVVDEKLTVFAGTAAEVSDAFPAIIPFSSEGQGAISRFATLNPVLRVSGGTSGTGLASAVGFIFTPSDSIDIRALYGNVNASFAGKEANNLLGAGFFNGSYVAATQITIKPTDTIDIGLNYAHSFHELNITGMALGSASTNVLAGLPLNTPVNLDSVGATLAWRIDPKVTFTAYGSYIMVEDSGSNAFTDLTSWMAGLYFPDLLKEGNSAGLIVGQPLYREDAGNGALLTPASVTDRSRPLQIEAFYNFKINDNVSITPGAFVIFNPEGEGDNNTTGVGVVRTTFSF